MNFTAVYCCGCSQFDW